MTPGAGALKETPTSVRPSVNLGKSCGFAYEIGNPTDLNGSNLHAVIHMHYSVKVQIVK